MPCGKISFVVVTTEIIRASVMAGKRPNISEIPKDYPEEYLNLVTQCWIQKAEDRPQFSGFFP